MAEWVHTTTSGEWFTIHDVVKSLEALAVHPNQVNANQTGANGCIQVHLPKHNNRELRCDRDELSKNPQASPARRQKKHGPVQRDIKRSVRQKTESDHRECLSSEVRDNLLQAELREACGVGYSNELIERVWGSNFPEKDFSGTVSTCEPAQFSQIEFSPPAVNGGYDKRPDDIYPSEGHGSTIYGFTNGFATDNPYSNSGEIVDFRSQGNSAGPKEKLPEGLELILENLDGKILFEKKNTKKHDIEDEPVQLEQKKSSVLEEISETTRNARQSVCSEQKKKQSRKHVRCRNALILALKKNKSDGQLGGDAGKSDPRETFLLRPDHFLPNASKDLQHAAQTFSSKHSSSIRNEEFSSYDMYEKEFPPLS